MQSALHVTAKVLPGNRIEVQLPPGSEGQEVNVFVVLTDTTSQSPTKISAHFSDLAEMAADPDIKREIATINSEFLISEMDGLH